MREIKMGSLFSGSGGFELAGSMYGITPVWASEIEPFPIKVTETRFPDMKHIGDISKLSGKELEPVDVITGGSPCQDMSIAGKREGLDGERSGLFHEQIRLVTEMREKYGKPRFMVWENVPGAFSSNKGQDFRAVLEEIARVKQPGVTIPEPERKGSGGIRWNTAGNIVGNGYSIAWRVLDAQYWGVAQRRKRIYLVADFDGECAGKILFKPESLQWDIEKSAEAWQRASGGIENSVGKTGRITYAGGEPITLKIRSGCDGGGKGALMQIDKSATLGTHNDQTLFEAIPIADKATRHSGGGNTRNEDGAGNGLGIGAPGAPAYTLTAGDRHGVAYCLQGNMIGRAEKNGPQGNGVNEDVRFTLNTTDRHAVAYSFDKAAYNQGENSTYGIGLMEEVSHTLTAGWQPPAVACGIQQNASGEVRSSETSATLSTNGNASGRNAPLVAQAPACTYDCRNHAMNEELSGTLQAKENGGYSLNYINPVVVPEIAGTLTAKMEKGTGGPAGDECRNMVVLPEYKIRRLTPLECCRLQGFPDGWTDGLSTAEPSEEKIDKWEQIFEEHRKITGEPKNPRKRAQIIKWLKNPYSDTALYKMWGNGIALPCAAFVLKGIAQELNT